MSRQPKAASRRTDGFFTRMRQPVLFGLAAVLVLGLYYFFFVQRKHSYLTGRNFRYLATVGEQARSSLENQASLLRSFARLDQAKLDLFREANASGSGGQKNGNSPSDTRPAEQDDTSLLLREFAPGFEIESVKIRRQDDADPKVASAVLRRSAERIEFFEPLPAGQDGHGETLHGTVKLSHLLDPFFHPREVFDVLLLANARGEVLYHQGLRDLSVQQLAPLLRKSTLFAGLSLKERPNVNELLPSSSDSYSVELNGREYRLFVEPVALPLGRFDDEGSKPVIRTGEAWLICGLVPRKEFVYQSLAVSSALLFFLMGLLFLAILSWPFLKLKLLGETQRICVFDVLLLGVCSVLGVSIATLFVLDHWAFGKLKETSTRQLEELAASIDENARAEIQDAYQVLATLEHETLGHDWPESEVPNLWLDPKYQSAFSTYPFAHTFTLMQQNGNQIYKATVNKRVPALVPVGDRAYFQRARDGEVWALRGLKDGPETDPSQAAEEREAFFIEQIVAKTNGARYAMLSKPAAGTGGRGVVVSALGIPMVSLINPVLPPGFKFAVVDNEDPNGKVLFHSDPERNSIEDFLVETDHDRRLRSAIFARRGETMKKIRYWGEDYIARTEPVRGLPWTVVALKDLQVLRSVNGDWLSTTLLFLLFYVSLLAALMVAVALARPSYRAEWIWPDLRRHEDYQALVSSYLLAATGFLLAILGLRGSGALIAVSFLVPALALVMAYSRLRRRTYGREALALGSGLLLLLVLATFLFRGQQEPEGAVLALLFLAGGFFLATGALPFRSWMMPFAPWTRPAPEPAASSFPKEGLPTRRSILQIYSVCGALLLLLTAVLPTAGFFKTAHRVHSESYLRHGQLKLAQELKRRAIRAHQRVDRVGDTGKEGLLAAWLQVEPCEGAAAKLGRDVYSCSFYDSWPELSLPDAPLTDTGNCKCDEEDDSDALPGFLEGFLPRSSKHVVEMRELLHDNSSDCTWFWKNGANDPFVLHSNDYPDGAIHLTSVPPPGTSATMNAAVLPGLAPLLGRLKSADLWDVFLLVSLPALFGFVVLLSRFVSRKIFLIDLLEPLWKEQEETGPATTGRNIFLVTQGRPWKNKEDASERFFCLNLARLEDSEDAWPAIRPALLRGPHVILVEGFEHRLGDDAFDTRKLEVLEDLAAMPDRTIVVVSPIGPDPLFARRTRRGRNGQMSPTIQQRLRTLLSSFTIRDESLRVPPEIAKRHAHTLLGELIRLVRRQHQEQKVEAASQVPDILREECGTNPHLTAIAKELDDQVGHLSREQVLEELGERAERYYHSLWESCSTEEQVVLEHLAEEGLVNEKSRKVLRRLMSRGIVRRTPRYQLMNETFRRFVISAQCRGEVLSIEKKAAPSAWDRLRTPFFISLAASIAFFFATQEALLEGIVASITGLTAGLPGIVKVFDVFGGERSKLRLGGPK